MRADHRRMITTLPTDRIQTLDEIRASLAWPEGMDDAALEAAFFPAQPLSQGPGPVRTGRRCT